MSFFDLGLHRNILRAISDIGYVKPFYIQKKCIPYVLKGRDVLGLAETGSGKTAAFLLPLLHNIDPVMLFTQVLVLVPTRELAIQLKNVCSVFSKYIQGINIVSLYGGQCYDIQFRFLKQCPQIVIGTPGRLLDHLKRRTLCLSKLHSLVIDEADEMLRMGFIDDVKLITSKVPENHQTIFFSATLPKEIRRIARSFMNNPKEIYINLGEDKILIPSFIEQNYLIVSGFHKQEALMRFLEVENFDAVIVFVRTKEATLEIASMLEENGYNSAALNGDMNQVVRQRTLERLRNRKLDILIATDVAARGLDVDRVTLVINYDAPMDIDSYIHRIGRTGRAGRNGRSLLFIKHSDYRLLRYIEKNKNLSISKVKIPSLDILMKSRLSKFSDKVKREFVNHGTDLEKYRSLLFKIKPREDCDIERLAAVLLKIAEGRRSLIISSDIKMKKVNKDCFKRGVKMSRNQIKMRHFVGKTNRRVYNSFNTRSFR